jgi:hypothetical protein
LIFDSVQQQSNLPQLTLEGERGRRRGEDVEGHVRRRRGPTVLLAAPDAVNLLEERERFGARRARCERSKEARG